LGGFLDATFWSTAMQRLFAPAVRSHHSGPGAPKRRGLIQERPPCVMIMTTVILTSLACATGEGAQDVSLRSGLLTHQPLGQAASDLRRQRA
jgi:hypothetical protein